MVHRSLNLPEKHPFFLFGPRQTGKSTLLREKYGDRAWTIDLLLGETFLSYSKNPSIFRHEALAKLKAGCGRIIIDEVQRVPALLEEAQWLIDHKVAAQFIFTGSSARKLKRGRANLLAGRCVERHLFPFTAEELGEDFVLERAMAHGTLPAVWSEKEADRIDLLRAYVSTYLREEIQQEGISRNLGGFARFLDIAAAQCGEQVSFSAVSRECQLPVRTVQSYYEILEDTLIAVLLHPWQKSVRKRLVAHPKCYFFDMGVTNALCQRLTGGIDSQVRGRLFEQWVVLETQRRIDYAGSEARIFFWRTNHGAEVDLLIEKHGRLLGAFEIKSAPRISTADTSGLRSFGEEHPKVFAGVVGTVANTFNLGKVTVFPWKKYFEWLAKAV